WNLFADYFPLKLVKTADLSPGGTTSRGSHPHGVLSIGPCATFLTESTGFSNYSILTLNGQFWFPLRREFGFAIGGAESSRASLKLSLRNPGKTHPCSKPVTSVMGAPIRVDRVDNPTDLEVDPPHQKYCDALVELFEKHKSLYNVPENQHINVN
ncbi:hypothetical protein PMAYCL1PPCAC_09927, partial [Pristionchus mayeri]